MPVETCAAIEPRAAPSTLIATATMRCLVVARSDRQRRLFIRSATEAGWEAVWCRSAEEACRQARLRRTAFALIDLGTSATGESVGLDRLGVKTLIQSLHEDGALVAIGLPNGDCEAEVWARCLGVWACLPDVNETCDLPALCREARAAVKQLARKSGN